MRVAAVQMDVAILEKERNLEKILRRTEEGAAAGAELIVFPECALTGYCFKFGLRAPVARGTTPRSLCPVFLRSYEPSSFGTALRTRGVGPLARQQARPRGRSTWSRAVRKPDPSYWARDLGFRKRPTIPNRNGAVARALFDELVNKGRRLFKKERVM